MAKYFNFTTGKIETDDDLIYNPKTAETIAKPINISRTPVPTVKAAPNKTNTYGPVQTSKTHALSAGFYQPKTGGGGASTALPASKAGAHRTRGMTIVPEPRLTGVNPGTRPTGTVQSIRHSNKAQNNNPSWVQDMFAQDRNYIDLIKEGDIAGAAANFVGSGIQGAQSLFLNGINAIDAVAHGENPTFIYNMDKATYDRQVANRRGVEKTIGDKISDFNTGLGIAYSIANEGLSDPMELLAGGFYNDLSKSLGAAKPGSINYGEAMKAGKMIPKDGLNISPDAWKENDPILQFGKQNNVAKGLDTRYNQVGGEIDVEGLRANNQLRSPDIFGMEADGENFGGGFDPRGMGSYTRAQTKNKRKTFEFREPTEIELSSVQKALINQGNQDNISVQFAKENIAQVINGKSAPIPAKGVYLGDGKMILTGDGESYRHELYHYFDEVIPQSTQKFKENVQSAINMSSPDVQKYLQARIEDYTRYNPSFKPEKIWDELAAAIYNFPDDDGWRMLFGDYDSVLKDINELQSSFDAFKAGGKQGLELTDQINDLKDVPFDLSPFGKNTVGAAQTNPVSYEHLQNQFGTIPPGELPHAREADVPLQTAEGNRVRQFTRTMMEAPATPDELIGEFEKGVARGEFSYSPKKDKDALNMAVKSITDKGYDGALSQWEDVIEGWRAATKDDIVLAQMLYAEAAKAGDVQTAMKLAAEIAAEGTRAGQNVQALRLLKKMTPQGQLYYAERSLQNLQQDLIKRFGDKAPHLSIDENLVQELLSAKGEKAVQAAFDKIAKNIADQIPSSWSDKWNAWRYLSMLGNPRTHVRNIIGNAVFTPVRKLKNLIGAGLENVTDASLKAAGKDGIARTKAVTLPFVDTKIKEYGAKDFEDIKNVITGTGKYNPTDLIQSHKTVFNNRFLEWLRKANEGALDAEDVWFMKNAYVDSFTQYIKANGLDVRTLEKSAEGMQKLGEARKYAILEAQKATFRDANKLADALAKLENTNKITKVGVGGLLPFKKTPANIVKRGLEYSPAGLIKGITYDLAQVKKGAKTAAEAIDQIASGLSGTGIALLGGYLASKGILTGAGSSDKKERTFDRLQGSQNYALNIGDVSYTLDWAAPAALPLFVGVETYNAAKAAKEGFNFTDFADAMLNITEPVFDMTMLDGVNSAIKAAGYDLGNAFSGMGKQVATNYFGQAVPTLSGQIARTIDGTRRTAYHDKNSGVPQWIDEFAQKQAAKLPGATYLLQPYIDAWGRESEPKPIMQRAFENFLSPGYISKRNVTPADEAINGLYEATGERSVLPTYANKDFTVDNEKLNLSAQQYTDFARQRGQTAKGLIEAVARQKEYQNLALSDQVAIISDIYAYANAIGKTGVSGYQLDGWVKNAYEAQQAGVPLETYLLQRKAYNNLVSEDDNARSDQYREMLFANDALTVQQKTELDKRLIGGENLPDYSSLDNFILSRMSGASQELYRVASVRQAVGSVENYRKVNNILGSVEADKDEYGNAVSGTSKPKAINAIATVLAISWQQAENIYNELCVFDHSISELPSTKRQAYETLSKIGLSGERFLNYYNQTKIISGSKDTNGKTISGSQKQNRYRRLRDLGLTDAQAKKFLKEVYGYKY